MNKRGASLLLGGVASLAFASASLAQQAAPAPDAGASAPPALGEIVVTARFAKESLQKTPLAVTALSAATLERQGANNISDVAASVPNVTIMTGGSTYGKSAQAFIRGVGQVNFNFAFEPAVGFYVDDVYHGTVFGSLFELDDVDRVEILRGPQGTLFGKSNEGGAVRVYTVEPRGDGHGYVEVGYGDYGRERVRGAIDMTLIPDKVFLRVAGGAEQSDGWFTRYDYACLHPATAGKLVPLTTASDCKLGTEGGEKVNTARATLRIVPNDNLNITIRGNVTDDRSEADPTKLLAVNNAAGTGINDYNNNVAIPLFGIPLDSRFITNSPFTSYATYQETSTGRTIPPISTNYSYGVSAVINWRAPFGLRIKNILGYESSDGKFAINGTESPIPDFVILQHPSHHQLTEEINISGQAFNNKLDWTIGAFYYDAKSIEGGYALLPGLEIVPPQGAGSPFAPNGFYGLDFTLNDPVLDSDASGFVHAVYRATDKLSIEAGLRYTAQSKTYTFVRTALATNPVDPIFPAGQPVGGLFNVGAQADTNRIDPKLAIQYQWTPNFMTYVQVSTGYKGAGINSQPVLPKDVTPFGAETLTALELGMKSEWFEKRLRVNATVFHSDYKNLQLNTYTADGSNQTINTGEMYIEGVELEMNAAPVSGLLLNASGGYLWFDTLSLGLAAHAPAAFAPTLKTQPPYVPKFKMNLGVQYAIDLGKAGTLTPRLDWTYQSRVFNDPTNDPLASQAGYSLVNARLSYEPEDTNWMIAIEVKNLLDKKYYVNMSDFLPSYGTLDAQPGPPRTIFATVRRSF